MIAPLGDRDDFTGQRLSCPNPRPSVIKVLTMIFGEKDGDSSAP
jgi:hypothetical protein